MFFSSDANPSEFFLSLDFGFLYSKVLKLIDASYWAMLIDFLARSFTGDVRCDEVVFWMVFLRLFATPTYGLFLTLTRSCFPVLYLPV